MFDAPKNGVCCDQPSEENLLSASERYCRLKVSDDFVSDLRQRTSDSPGEVVIVAPRRGGKVLLHTKDFYPEGVYRLPTGKIKPGEPADQAFFREFVEELGFEGEIDRLLGILGYHLLSGRDSYDFKSHVYLAHETANDPKPCDSAELITAFIEVPMTELGQAANRLRNLSGRWHDWGRFRAVAHTFVWKALEC